ncbi:MAG: DEAD/DEAH box helicase [Desulfobacterales bacterium]|nr:DEAD/DEAH box helicase [Desulfobacterales bacterium]
MSGLTDAGFEYCTPIQAEALPVLLQGRDVAGQAHTGTGKTAAFLVTVISRLLAMPDRKSGLPPGHHHGPHPRAVPRRSYEEAAGPQPAHGHHPARGGRAASTTGSRPKALQKGADIVIGTPGRIIDYYKQGILKTKDIKFLVIDEADRLLDMGFEKDMRFILRKLPPSRSASPCSSPRPCPTGVLELTYEFMNLPEFISVIPDKVTVDGIEQTLFHVGSDAEVPAAAGPSAARGLQRACSSSST